MQIIVLKKTVMELENEIKSIERSLIDRNGESTERLNEIKESSGLTFS